MKLITPHISSKYKLLLENSQEMMIFFNPAGGIIDCSLKTKEETGYGDDIFLIQISDIFRNVFIYEENKLKIDKKYLNSLHETIAYRKNQTCFLVDLKVCVINTNKKYIGICTATNISEKKNAIREINELKNDLNNYNQISSEIVARIAHELRTPANGILGFSNNLLDMELKSNQIEAVNIIKRCCNNMNTIINDLLDFAKVTNNKLVIEHREFSFSDFIQHIVDINLVHINEKGLKLLLNISNDIPDRVIGDEHRLSQIVNNLFSNAIKFTSVGQINLEVDMITQTEQYIELLFILIDTGIGIGREDKDKLFKSFTQVDSSITRRFGGTGLGLSICKKLVEAMHGTIEVDSEKNKGSTFSFSVRLGLPLRPEEDYSHTYEQYDQVNLCRIKYEANLAGSEEKSEISDLDYINKILQDITPPSNEDGVDDMQKALSYMNELIEKLTICIEMENWERAEELAYRIKNIIPNDHTVNSNITFRLLLAVRKENHDVSLAIINEIKACMYKEK